MKTQYIKPEIQMVLLENMLMANYTSWTVDNANNVKDPDCDDHGHIFGPDTNWGSDTNWGNSSDPFDCDNW